MSELLSAVELDPVGPVRSSVVWLHGLGADGHDFAAIVPELDLPHELGVRFVLPHAPSIPVTLNAGMVMPAWYDILDLSHPRAVNWDTVDDSAKAIQEILLAETAPTVVLAGFSQGAAMALHHVGVVKNLWEQGLLPRADASPERLRQLGRVLCKAVIALVVTALGNKMTR